MSDSIVFTMKRVTAVPATMAITTKVSDSACKQKSEQYSQMCSLGSTLLLSLCQLCLLHRPNGRRTGLLNLPLPTHLKRVWPGYESHFLKGPLQMNSTMT